MEKHSVWIIFRIIIIRSNVVEYKILLKSFYTYFIYHSFLQNGLYDKRLKSSTIICWGWILGIFFVQEEDMRGKEKKWYTNLMSPHFPWGTFLPSVLLTLIQVTKFPTTTYLPMGYSPLLPLFTTVLFSHPNFLFGWDGSDGGGYRRGHQCQDRCVYSQYLSLNIILYV